MRVVVAAWLLSVAAIGAGLAIQRWHPGWQPKPTSAETRVEVLEEPPAVETLPLRRPAPTGRDVSLEAPTADPVLSGSQKARWTVPVTTLPTDDPAASPADAHKADARKNVTGDSSAAAEAVAPADSAPSDAPMGAKPEPDGTTPAVSADADAEASGTAVLADAPAQASSETAPHDPATPKVSDRVTEAVLSTDGGAAVSSDGASAADDVPRQPEPGDQGSRPALPASEPLQEAETLPLRSVTDESPRSAREAAGAPAVARPASIPEAIRVATAEPDPNRPKSGNLSVAKVEYDEGGEVVLSGSASPGTTVRVRLDGETLGEVEADGEGQWRLRPERPVASGQYELEAEEIGTADAVRPTVTLPFAKAENIADLPLPDRLVVQPGNNLWRLAERLYGDGLAYVRIYEANRDQIDDPDLIFPGQIFRIPAPEG